MGRSRPHPQLGQPQLKSQIVKHSVAIAGRKTSVSVERAFGLDSNRSQPYARFHFTVWSLKSQSEPSSESKPTYRRRFEFSCSNSIASRLNDVKSATTRPDTPGRVERDSGQRSVTKGALPSAVNGFLEVLS
jgi:hypothetical protein